MARPSRLALVLSAICLIGTAASADGVTYEYDVFGRVVKAVYVITGQSTKTVVYAYDEAGNRITVSVTLTP